MVRRLLVRVGEREQPAFVPGTAKDRQARGECAAACETHRDRDRRKPCRRRIDLAVVARQIRSHVADNGRRIAPRRVDERIEFQRRQTSCDTLDWPGNQDYRRRRYRSFARSRGAGELSDESSRL